MNREHLQYQRYVETHNSACEERREGREILYKSLRIHWIQKRVLNKTKRRRLLQDFHGLVVLRWVVGCLGQLRWHYPTLESGLDILRSLGDEEVDHFQFMIQPQIRPEVFDITCVSSISAGKAVALFVKSPVLSSRLPLPDSLYSPPAGGFPCKFSKSSPLSNSVQTELICVAGCQFSLKRWLDLLSPVLYLQGFSPSRLPNPPPSPASYLRCGAVWAWSVPWSLLRSSSTT